MIEEVMVDLDKVVNQIIIKLEEMKFEDLEWKGDRGGDYVVGRRRSKEEGKISFTIEIGEDLEEYEDEDEDY